MLSIRLSSVPEVFKKGSLFQVLNNAIDDYEEEVIAGKINNDLSSAAGTTISIPAKYCQFSLCNLHDLSNVCALIETLRYWGMSETPIELVLHLLESPLTNEAICMLAGEHREGDEFSFLADLARFRNQVTFQKRMEYAAEHGPVSLLSALHAYYSLNEEGLSQLKLCEIAARSGQLGCLRFLHERGFLLEGACSAAAGTGHLDCLQYAHEQGCKFYSNTCSRAAQNGHLDCLQYAHEHGCPWDVITSWRAAESGHLDCLKFAHEHGCKWDVFTTSRAAEFGHLDCLKFAHEHGCKWDIATTSRAAQNGHLDCLQYAHENGCPWDSSTTHCAAEYGHLDCLQYAQHHGCLL
jgi:hypothetical protein